MSLPEVSGMETIKALSRAGFVVVRQRGSHVSLEKRTVDEVIRLTVPLHSSLKKGTLRRIISDAGLTVQEFKGLL
jgi:predicted RNA binding protein YcfA (HicA-like mRNA interferase family)